jgi:hypothetical protein
VAWKPDAIRLFDTNRFSQKEESSTRFPCFTTSAFETKKHWRKVMAVLGIEDPYIWGGYVIAIALAIICAIYGFLKWNSEEEEDTGEGADG